MNVVLASAAFGVLIGLSSSCFAATQATQGGVIRFIGSIVETNCASSTVSTGLNLRQCPQGSRGGAIEVTPINPQVSVKGLGPSAVKVKLISDSGRQGRYYDQHYAFVDQSGKAVTSGTYLVTLSVP